jgi:putative transcriptional regulator
VDDQPGIGLMAELDNRIRVFRAERRMSQADLAEAIGVSRKTISTIEVGRFVPSTVVALRIAKFFQVPVEQVFWLTEQERDWGQIT